MIGFDRQLKKEWLDLVVEMLHDGETRDKVTEALNKYMANDLKGKEAIRKTRLVINRIWFNPNSQLEFLRHSALGLFNEARAENATSIIHWGMCIACYPYFRDIARICGRLINLQGYFKRSQVRQRTIGIWGERPVVKRTVDHVIQTIIYWNLVKQEEATDKYVVSELERIKNTKLVNWLIKAYLVSRESKTASIDDIRNDPVLFPFSIDINIDNLLINKEIELFNQGLKSEILILRTIDHTDSGIT
ncbi:MAG: hypothetical protein J7L34_07760 [Thermotogaceae bacterium]|nr:hypothetical protein [Thermotogaceae bacterium]